MTGKKDMIAIIVIAITIFLLRDARAESEYLKKNNSTFELSFSHYYFDYKEDVKLPAKSQERGWLDGPRFQFTHREIPSVHTLQTPVIYQRFLFEFTNGNTTYDGSLQNMQTGEITPHKSSTKNTFWTLEGDFGGIIKLAKTFDLTPYLGLGYRHWTRDLEGEGSYTEKYSWWYFPLGLRTDYYLTEDMTWSLDGSYRIMFGGSMQAFLSEWDSHLNDPEFILGNEPGYKIEMPISYRFLVFTPWYEHSAIGKSNKASLTYTYNGTVYDTDYQFQEPASQTSQYGFNLGVIFQF